MNLDEFDPEKADFGNDIETEEPTTEPEVAQEQPAAEAPAEAPAAEAASEPAAEPEAEAPAAAAEEDKKPDPMIPKHRLDYIQSKRREAEQRAQELEARLAELEARSQEAAATEVPRTDMKAELETRLSELDVKIEEARLDGDTKQVAAMLAEQRRLERDYLVGDLQPRAEQPDTEQTYAQVRERMQFDQLVQGLEQAFPQFKEGSPDFDQDLVDEVLDMHAAFSARGATLVDSMVKAANYVLRANGLLTDAQLQQQQQEAPKAPEPRKTDVARNVAAANAQPPALDKAGMDSDKAGVSKPVDITKMSMSEFESLSDEALAKMRGDFDV